MSKYFSNSSSKHLFFIVTTILVFIILFNPPVDPDMWWHLKSGQTMWQEKTILVQDQFSFTKFGQPWVNAFWISDLIIYFLYNLGGFPFLLFVLACLGAALFALIFSISKGHYFLRSGIILLAAISISPEWTARPQVFSFILFALLNIWLNKRKNGIVFPLYFLPIFFIIWANMHGGFIWGFFLLFATILGYCFDYFTHFSLYKKAFRTELKQLLIWTTISFLAILINPNGFALWQLPFTTISVSISTIQEWMSPNFHNLEMQPFLWIILLLITGYSLSCNRQSFRDIFKVVGFVYLAFVSQRNIPIAVIVMTPLIIEKFSNIFFNNQLIETISIKEPPKTKFLFPFRWIFNSLIISVLLVFSFLRINIQLDSNLIEKTYPTNALIAINDIFPTGNMFNSYDWGGYLIWNIPNHPVFIDGRADLYGEEIINDWWTVVNGTDKALEVLDEYKITLVILEPDWPVIDLLKTNNWEVIYQDEISIVMKKITRTSTN